MFVTHKTIALLRLSMVAGCLIWLSTNIYALNIDQHERHETCPQHFPKTTYSTNQKVIAAPTKPIVTAPVVATAPISNVVQSTDNQASITPVNNQANTKECPFNCVLNINFAFASNVLPASFDVDIEKLSKYLKDNPDAHISVVGHTDNIGIDERNQLRSAARAKALSDKLVENGIDSSRITTSGEGSSHPIASNETDEGRAQNRRIEIVIQ